MKRFHGVVFAGLFLAAHILAQSTAVMVQGFVRDTAGAPIPGAVATLLETGTQATADSLGVFHLQSALGIFRPGKTTLPGFEIASHGLLMVVKNFGSRNAEISWLTPEGRVVSRWLLAPHASRTLSLGTLSPKVGMRILALSWGDNRVAYPVFIRNGVLQALAASTATGSSPEKFSPLARIATDSLPRLTVEVTATGFLPRRARLTQATVDSLPVTLLPQNASLQAQVQALIGDGLTLRLAWMTQSSGVSGLSYADLAEIKGDSLPTHAWANAQGATLPAWSPDGKTVAYETGAEGSTINSGGKVSRIYLQPLSGARMNGPAYPATNPRFWVHGVDTALIWCTSGFDYGWDDTASATYRQPFVGGQLSGTQEKIATGSYNAGLSRDGNWLAGGSPRGVLLNRSTGDKVFFHVYPGSVAPLPDSVQICNMSISPDTATPSRALFEDFGVAYDPGYANMVTPKRYGQHQILLIADAQSTEAGHIVDFIDTPPAELALGKTWDDPEWSNQPDFAVASTRMLDNSGNLVQPDLYLIKISTRECLRIFSGGGYYMPIAWLGPR